MDVLWIILGAGLLAAAGLFALPFLLRKSDGKNSIDLES
jgi:hypothetical protein